MSLLQERFQLREISGIPYPDTQMAFTKFVGAESPRALDSLSFDEIEKLPGIKDVLLPIGGGRRLGKCIFTWVVNSGGENWTRGEQFIGMGEDYKKAALSGLLVFWEMVVLRRKTS